MTLDALIPLVARFLAAHRIRYFAIGGVGVSLWGHPRTTRDLDVVLLLERPQAPGLVAELNRLGFRIAKSLARKLMEGRMIQLPVGETELDLKICTTRHDREALERATVARFADFTLSVGSPEDLILYKLQSWRRQDQADIENLLTHARGLDAAYIRSRLKPLEKETGAPLRARWNSIAPRAT